MDVFLKTVLETVQKYRLFQKGDTALVALSGGADSVALLHTLMLLQDVLEFAEIRAIHVNHGIRGDAADRDERFAQALCDELNIPLTVKHVDVPAVVSETGESVEDVARKLRYACFDEEASLFPNAKIVTAHTADDQTETILLRLVRGCGLKGVCGIPVLRDTIVRPLLQCSAEDVRSFCERHRYAYVVDETNFDLCYSRNRIRHEVLPALKQINPSVGPALIRFAQLASEDEMFLNSLATELLDSARMDDGAFSVPILMKADPAVRKRALHQLWPAEFSHITQLNDCLGTGGTVNFPQDCSAISDGKRLRLVHHDRCKRAVCEDTRQSVSIDQARRFNRWVITPRVITYDEYKEKAKIHKNLFNFCISYDMIEHDLVLRSRKSGDVLRPFGRGCTKTIKKLMNEHHIPPEKRTDFPLVVCGDKVLMVLGLCVDEAVSVTSSTKAVLWFDITQVNTDHDAH